MCGRVYYCAFKYMTMLVSIFVYVCFVHTHLRLLLAHVTLIDR